MTCHAPLWAVGLLAAVLPTAGCRSDRGSAGASDAAAAAGGLPCDVAAVLKLRCQGCHAQPPRMNAPMPLLTWDDTQKPGPYDKTALTWQAMRQAIQAGDMPPSESPTGPLAAPEKVILLRWLDASAPRGTVACGPGGGGGTVTP